MQVKLIGKSVIADQQIIDELKTASGEALVMYTARVSNPNNQSSNNPKLLEYCANAKHWSVFSMCDMIVEIVTSRAISAQILRHKSFDFQEFSQRYAKVTEYEQYEARRQDSKNRQNSIDDMAEEDKIWFAETQKKVQEMCDNYYGEALTRGVAKEQARMLLPMSSKTKLYMKGSLRSWIHYIQVRTDPSTQKEHREIAEECKRIFVQEFPIIAEALNWK